MSAVTVATNSETRMDEVKMMILVLLTLKNTDEMRSNFLAVSAVTVDTN